MYICIYIYYTYKHRHRKMFTRRIIIFCLCIIDKSRMTLVPIA